MSFSNLPVSGGSESSSTQRTEQPSTGSTTTLKATTTSIAQNALQKAMAQPIAHPITSTITSLQTTQPLATWSTLIQHFMPSISSSDLTTLAEQFVAGNHSPPTIEQLTPFCNACSDENNSLTVKDFEDAFLAFKIFSHPLEDETVEFLLSIDFTDSMIQKVYEKLSDPESKSLLARFTQKQVLPPVTMTALQTALLRGKELLQKFKARKKESPQEHQAILEKAMKCLPIKEQKKYVTELRLVQCQTDKITLRGLEELIAEKNILSDKDKEIIAAAVKRTIGITNLYIEARKTHPKPTTADRFTCVELAVNKLLSIQPNMLSLFQLQQEIQAKKDPFKGFAEFFIIDGVRSNTSFYPRCLDIHAKVPRMAPLDLIAQALKELLAIKQSVATLSFDALEKVLVQDLYPSEVDFILKEAIKNPALLTRFTQLRLAHSQWDIRATLQRAVRQLAQIEKMQKNPDISLGEISGLLRRHLSAPENKKICDIIAASNGPQAKKIAAELQNKTLQESVDFLIQELASKETITYADMQLLKGVKCTESQAQSLLTHINQKIAHTQDANLQALVSLCEAITSNWTISEATEPSAAVILSIALYVDSYFRELTPTTQIAERILFPAVTHARRSLAITKEGIHILPRERVSYILGKGTSKYAEAVMSIFSAHAPPTTSTPKPPVALKVKPGVRLIANTPRSIRETLADVTFAQPFENEVGFLQCHGVIQCNKKTKPKISAFYDRCEGPINKEELTDEQQIQVIKDLLTAEAALHAKDVFHFDVKPDNLLCIIDVVTGKARGFLIDFNLSGKKARQATYNEGFYGSYIYTPPELLSHTGTEFTGDHAACENFALGTSLYLMHHPTMTIAPWEEGVYDLYAKTCDKQTAINSLNTKLAEYHRGQASLVQKAASNEPMTKSEIIEYIISRLLLANPTERWKAPHALEELNRLLSPRTSTATPPTTVTDQTAIAQQIDRPQTAPPRSIRQGPPTVML